MKRNGKILLLLLLAVLVLGGCRTQAPTPKQTGWFQKVWEEFVLDGQAAPAPIPSPEASPLPHNLTLEEETLPKPTAQPKEAAAPKVLPEPAALAPAKKQEPASQEIPPAPAGPAGKPTPKEEGKQPIQPPHLANSR